MSAAPAKAANPTANELRERLQTLRTKRSSWEIHWRELAQYVAPRRTRFWQAEAVAAGVKKHAYVINSTATLALRTLASGMMAGITSPARPWFRLTVPSASLAQNDAIHDWLHQVEDAMLAAMARTNVYNGLHHVYTDLPLFGTAVMVIEEDDRRLMRAVPIPTGEYFLALDEVGVVDTLYHDTSMTVRQVVKKFGEENCSNGVRDLYRKKDFDSLVEVVHCIMPRAEYDPARSDLDPKHRPFGGYWFEKGVDAGAAKFLEESGYHENPIIAPRWSVTGVNVYGDSPAMDALGDIKELQLLARTRARAAEMIVDPPMAVPGQLRARGGASLLPGQQTFLDGAAGGLKAEPLVTIPPQAVAVMDASIGEVQRRINATLYADLWLMLSQDEQGQPITAREVQERHEEKMLQLGPVMERLEDELLNPVVARVYGILARRGLLPTPPDVMGQAGIDGFDVEYVSIMSQAQKMVAAAGIQQLVGFAQNIATVAPEVMDKVDTDAAVALMADALSTAPTLVRPDDKVAAMRKQRAQAQAQAQQSQQAMAAAQAAKNLGQANMGGDTALSRMVGGVPAAQAEGPGGGVP